MRLPLAFRTLLAVVGLTLGTAAAAPVLAADQEASILVEKGLAVRVVFDQDVTSGKAAIGTEFPVHVVDNLIANGYVVVKAGAAGVGRVTAVTPAGRGTPGSLAYEIYYVMAVDGKKLRLTPAAATPKSDGVKELGGGKTAGDDAAKAATDAATDQTKSAAAEAGSGTVVGPVAGAVAGSLAGSVTSMFGGPKKGPEAVVPAKTAVTAYVFDTVHIASTTKAPDDGFAH